MSLPHRLQATLTPFRTYSTLHAGSNSVRARLTTSVLTPTRLPTRFSSTMGSQEQAQHEHVLGRVRQIIPPLSPLLHKGQAGRIGVLGGSGDYSGAPFFSAMGAMRFGADLAHVICEPAAGAVIKTYAPDLIVHGVLDESRGFDNATDELKSVMERMHVLIIGPGLGRSEFMQSCARRAFQLAESMEIGIVVDADGLWLLNSEPELVRPLAGRIILTPNIMEFKRLCSAVGIEDDEPEKHCAALAEHLGNVVVVQKGQVDRISDGRELPPVLLGAGSTGKDALISSVQGGLKRVGGQGDILSGTMGTLLAWGREWARGAYSAVGHPPEEQLTPYVALIAAYGASAFNRTVSRRGFEKMGRSMVTHDLVELVGPVYEEMFGAAKGDGADKGKL